MRNVFFQTGKQGQDSFDTTVHRQYSWTGQPIWNCQTGKLTRNSHTKRPSQNRKTGKWDRNSQTGKSTVGTVKRKKSKQTSQTGTWDSISQTGKSTVGTVKRKSRNRPVRQESGTVVHKSDRFHQTGKWGKGLARQWARGAEGARHSLMYSSTSDGQEKEQGVTGGYERYLDRNSQTEHSQKGKFRQEI